ncbi:MAG TPA: PKD domain-containing protein, partial [Thermoplasmata archaeon]|nr:PKD domain-containing protein [Thermoplasmata archaeon]
MPVEASFDTRCGFPRSHQEDLTGHAHIQGPDHITAPPCGRSGAGTPFLAACPAGPTIRGIERASGSLRPSPGSPDVPVDRPVERDPEKRLNTAYDASMMNRGCRGALRVLVIAVVLTVTAGPPLRKGVGLHDTPAPLTQGIGERLSIASGDGQTAPAGTVFPTPLTVLLLDYNGTPMAGEGVLFSLVEGPSPTHLEGGGHLGAAVTVQTNETGLARAWLHGGDGEGRIRVNVTWGNETVMFTAFTARVVAHLTMEGENVTGAMILFDANNSKGNISGYVFDFGDGARSGLRVVPRVIHVYTRSGTYRVEVIVYDARNITDVATLLVTIREREREAAMTPYLAWGVEAALFLLLAAALYAF